MGADPSSADVMRAYVALGLPLNGPGGDELSPLTLVTRSCVGNPMSAATTAVLIAAGADPTLKAPDGNRETPRRSELNPECAAYPYATPSGRPDELAFEPKPGGAEGLEGDAKLERIQRVCCAVPGNVGLVVDHRS
jgi:hypothetical protein